MKSEGKDGDKLVYMLKKKSDLINVLRTAPTTPIFHIKKGEKHVYIAHGLGNTLLLLETKEPIPEGEEIPYSGERNINLIELSSIELLKLKDMTDKLSNRKK